MEASRLSVLFELNLQPEEMQEVIPLAVLVLDHQIVCGKASITSEVMAVIQVPRITYSQPT
jgi:hypothetical protein